MNSLNSGIALVKSPASFMESNKDKPATEKDLISYVAVLALIPLFATLIGDLWYYDVYRISDFVGYAFVYAVLLYIFDIAAVYILGVVIGTLAPSFSSSKDKIKALKLSAYLYTPAFLIAVVFLVPILDILGFLGLLYGLYIFYIGLPIMLGTSKDKVVPYIFVTIIAVVVIYIVFAVILGAATAALFHPHIGYF